MSQERCPDREALASFSAGALPTAAFDTVARHLASCSTCLAALEQTEQAAADPWRAALQTPLPPDPFASEPQCRQALDRAATAIYQALTDPGPAETVSAATTPPPAAAARPPAEFPAVPGYEILEKLGAGGMGVVYKALHTELNRVVALKMVRAGTSASRDDRDRFLTEARAVAALQHPNIVQIFELGTCHDQPYFSLEFVDGGSLAAAAQRPLPPDRAAALLEDLARAVQYAHEQGVLHRDLKPSNVLLTKGGTPKITDFGLARLATGGGLTQPGVALGTPSYMAPEQAAGESQQVGPPADVYGLGAILYHLLCGRPPFRAATSQDTLRQVLSREPERPSRLAPGMPPDLEAICLRCLRKAPAERHASAGALADDLRRFRGGQPVQVPPTAAARRRLVRRLALLAGAAVLALGAIVAVIVVGGGGPEPSPPGPAAPPAFRGSVDVLVLRKNALAEDDLLSLQDLRALPLVPGDHIRIEATVEPAAYLYLFWINSAGKAEPLFPWEEWKDVGLPRQEKPESKVSLPEEANQGFKFRTPGTGLETLLMLARSTPLTDSAEAVRGWFASLPDGRRLPAETYRAWFEDFRLVKNEPSRRALFEREDLGLPAFRLQRALQPRLAGRAGLVRAVSFAAVKRGRE
jgi:hypothetical protein